MTITSLFGGLFMVLIGLGLVHDRNPRSVVPMLLAGASLVVLGGCFVGREHMILRGSEIAEGRVVSYQKTDHADTDTTYEPQVKFEAHDKREIVFGEASSTFPLIDTGQRVSVAFDPENPEDARVLLFGYRFGYWFSLIGVGLFLIFVGLGFKCGDEWMRKVYVDRGLQAHSVSNR